MFDLLIRGGSVIDGSGTPARFADVAITDGLIVAIGQDISGNAQEIVDATGCVVTPGFVDIHTHYDAQVTWDDRLLPSSAHGVTTIVLGACGIGFAPVRPGTEDWLISLTEGVEDIPGSVLHEGIRWSWESFPDYLDSLDARRFAVDVAAHVPHSALRAYVMGERTLDNAAPTAVDLGAMAALTREAVAAGAIGLATSRLMTQHFGSDGKPLPGTNAAEDELLTLAKAVRDGGGGVIQIAPFAGGEDGSISTMGASGTTNRSLDQEIAMIRRLAADSGQPITFTMVESFGAEAIFERAMATLGDVFAKGEAIAPQFTAKPIGTLSTLDGYHAFMAKPSYLAIAELPRHERAARMRDPALKAAILTEDDVMPAKKLLMNNFPAMMRRALRTVFAYPADGFDYEPEMTRSVAALAAAAGVEPLGYLYDRLLDEDGAAILVVIATNYSAGDLRVTERMMREPGMLLGLADGGAHVRAIADASQPSFVLVHWARDRTRGATLPLEALVRKLTLDPATFYGLGDRGLIAPGRRADLNVFDPERLTIGRPYLVDDLPGGSLRFLQDARGYMLTTVGGVVTRRHDADTGARPGRLVRGRRTPAAITG